MNELKPCPFCGGEAETHEVGFPYHYWDIYCDGECFDHFCEKPTEAEAISAWNTRAYDDGEPMTEENMARHGWKRERTCKDVNGGGYTFVCSECTYELHMSFGWHFGYCPNCGAKVVSE